jgi:hypothetical protein
VPSILQLDVVTCLLVLLEEVHTDWKAHVLYWVMTEIKCGSLKLGKYMTYIEVDMEVWYAVCVFHGVCTHIISNLIPTLYSLHSLCLLLLVLCYSSSFISFKLSQGPLQDTGLIICPVWVKIFLFSSPI